MSMDLLRGDAIDWVCVSLNLGLEIDFRKALRKSIPPRLPRKIRIRIPRARTLTSLGNGQLHRTADIDSRLQAFQFTIVQSDLIDLRAGSRLCISTAYMADFLGELIMQQS